MSHQQRQPGRGRPSGGGRRWGGLPRRGPRRRAPSAGPGKVRPASRTSTGTSSAACSRRVVMGRQPGQQHRVGQPGERAGHHLHDEGGQLRHRLQRLHEAAEVARERRHHQRVGQQLGAARPQLGQRQRGRAGAGPPTAAPAWPAPPGATGATASSSWVRSQPSDRARLSMAEQEAEHRGDLPHAAPRRRRTRSAAACSSARTRW